MFSSYFDFKQLDTPAFNDDYYFLDELCGESVTFFKNHDDVFDEDAVEAFHAHQQVAHNEKTQKYEPRIYNGIAASFRAKRSMMFFSDVDILPLAVYQSIYNELRAVMRDSIDAKERGICAALALSMFTSIRIEQMTAYQQHIESFFQQKDGNYYIQIALDITQLDAEKVQSLGALRLNDTLTALIQVNKNDINQVKQSKFSIDEVKAVVSQLHQKLGLTYLTFSRMERTASVLLSRYITERLNKDVLTNTSASECTPVYYSSFNPFSLQSQHDNILQLLGGSPLIQETGNLDVHFGTQRPPSFSVATQILSKLREPIYTDDVSIITFNHYSMYIWHIFLLLTGARPTRGLGKRKNIDLKRRLIAVNDKNNRSVDNTRFVPLCNFLYDELTGYFEFEWQFLHKHQFDETLNGLGQLGSAQDDAYALYVIDNNKLKPASFAFIKQTLPHFSSNWGRHLARSYFSLTQVAPEHLVNAIFGHEKPHFECIGQFSSTSLSDIKSMTIHFDELAERLELQRVGSV